MAGYYVRHCVGMCACLRIYVKRVSVFLSVSVRAVSGILSQQGRVFRGHPHKNRDICKGIKGSLMRSYYSQIGPGYRLLTQ